MQNEPEPCPFCGDPMKQNGNDCVQHKLSRKSSARCILFHTSFQSTEAWNTRADLPPSPTSMGEEVKPSYDDLAEALRRFVELEYMRRQGYVLIHNAEKLVEARAMLLLETYDNMPDAALECRREQIAALEKGQSDWFAEKNAALKAASEAAIAEQEKANG